MALDLTTSKFPMQSSLLEDTDPEDYATGAIPNDAHAPINVSELDTHIDNNKQLRCLRERKLYPRSLYALLITYSRHHRSTGFAADKYFQLLVTDFTGFDTYRKDYDDTRPGVYKKFTDSLGINDDNLLLVDCHIKGLYRLKNSLKKFITPPEGLTELPQIDLTPSAILLKIKCCAKCFRGTIELQRCFPEVLEKLDLIQSLDSGDKYLYDFLVRLNKKYPAKYKLLLEQRYELSKLLDKYNPKTTKTNTEYDSIDTSPPQLMLKKNDDLNGHIPLMTERTQSSEILADINKSSKSILTDLLLNSKETLKKTAASDSNSSRSVVVNTTLSRILNDSSLSGPFKLQDMVIIGYSGSPVLMKDLEGKLFLNDELRIMLATDGEPPDYVNGEKVYSKYLSVGFDQVGLFNFFNLSIIESNHDERYFIGILNKLIGKKFDAKINKLSVGGPLHNENKFWTFYGTYYLDILNA